MKLLRSRIPGSVCSLLTAMILAAIWSACSDAPNGVTPPDAVDQESPGLDLHALSPGEQLRALTPAMRVQESHSDRLLSMPGVIGTATGLTDAGRPTVTVYATASEPGKIPQDLDGYPIRVIVTEPFVALQEARKKCDNPPCGNPGGGGGEGGDVEPSDPTERFRPVRIGVSTGHPDITAGTIGAIVRSGNTRYFLSNNHVFANENLANYGDAILQPGRFDGGREPGDVVGTLAEFAWINFSGGNNTIDAAIARITLADANVINSTPSDGYGTPRSAPMDASIGLRVKKYGRTTGQTKGRVQGINATVNVGYDTGVARFVGQVIIGGGGFSAGGDSGSLIVVERGGNARRPVGLLFAGGGGITVANPIGEVLDYFNVSVDDQ